MLTAAERELIRRRIDEATRAGLGPIARPGHPSRFQSVIQVVSSGREVTYPSLSYYEELRMTKPRILAALNG
jgi:hypothetical protein